jgi:type I restriction-modification system DNA methylase subunit
MLHAATLEHFEAETRRLVDLFERNLATFKSPQYDEASLRQEFLNPFLRALGWDLENKAGHILTHREVEIESRTDVGGRKKRADYLFRTDRLDRFICEAKKPVEELRGHAFQAKRYVWNKGLLLGVLTDFEELRVYIVGSRPLPDEADVGLWKTWHFQQFAGAAREIWDLLSRSAVAAGSIEKLVDGLPKKPAGKGKGRGQWVYKPDRTRAMDAEFLTFLDEARRTLAQDLLKQNDREDLLEGNRLNEAVQRILDRLLFLRICEDRDIDTGRPLALILKNWRERAEHPVPRRVRDAGLWADDTAGLYAATGKRPPDWPLWNDIVAHFQALDRRPPSHIPFFNGNLFKVHFSEHLRVGDEWIANFLDAISDDETSYLFNYIPVEILGTIYERFLGKVVRPQGRGVTIEEKPEVRKAGGVYYTPRYIVDYIVEQTVGKLLEGRTPEQSLELRILDPACGSGSFLIRAFERVCEHWEAALMKNPSKRRRDYWLDPATNDVHLTTDCKRRILAATIHGVDLDSGAVEVTQLSLYLKMLEGENRTTLAAERELFGSDIALLPPLQDNIKCGNSLIASDFSMIPEDLVRVHAFDWPEQFRAIMQKGGFDAVIGNPPFIRIQTLQESDPSAVKFFKSHYRAAGKGNCDIYVLFVERSLALISPQGKAGFILPNKFLNAEYGAPLRDMLASGQHLQELVHFGAHQVFDGATTYTCLLFLGKAPAEEFVFRKVDDLKAWETKREALTANQRNEKLGATAWSFSVGAGAGLVERLKSLPLKLGEAADIFVGLQTSADDVFIMDLVSETSKLMTLRSKALEKEFTVEKELFHPLISGADVQGFCALPDRQFVLFPYDVSSDAVELMPFSQIEQTYPRTAAYLALNRTRLSMREKGRMRGRDWYGYIYLKNMRRQSQPKVCVPRLVDRLCAASDLVGRHFLDNVDVGGVTWKPGYEHHDLRLLLGLLNSSLLAWFFPNVSAPFRGGWMSANRQFLSQLPFRALDFTNPADRARHDKLVALVDKMLALTPKLRAAKSDSEKATLQNAVSATDRQIDALVYELYGLTPEEIALVEGGGS